MRALDSWNSLSIFRVLFRKHFENMSLICLAVIEDFSRVLVSQLNLVENIQRRETFVGDFKSTSLGNTCVLKLSSL